MFTFESIAYNSATNANAVKVNKPTGLAVGNLMVAVITNGGRNDPATAATASGWTQRSNTRNMVDSHYLDVTVLAKIADSSDTAASDFTFSVTNTTDVVLGAILRVSGSFPSIALSMVNDADTGGNGGKDTFTGGVTPNAANSLLIIGKAVAASKTNSFSSYSVANNNPSWTERADFGANYNDGATNDFLSLGIATATFAVDTATGNYSITDSDTAVNNAHGFLISIGVAPASVSVSGTTGIVELVGNNGSVTGAANLTGTTGIIELLGNDGAVTTPAQKWSNTNKSTAPSWSNKEKS